MSVNAVIRDVDHFQSFDMDNESPVPDAPHVRMETTAAFMGEYVFGEIFESDREFKLVMKDQRAVSVRGRGVKFVAAPTGEPFWGIVGSDGRDDLFVTLVPLADVRAVLTGDVAAYLDDPDPHIGPTGSAPSA